MLFCAMVLTLLLAVLPCAQATGTVRQVTPPQTINQCVALMQPGDVCEVATGTYPELLSSIRTLHTAPIPSGTATAPTTIRAAPGAVVWLAPTVEYPGGGGVITTGETSVGLHFGGLNIDAARLHTSGVDLEGRGHTVTRAEIRGPGPTASPPIGAPGMCCRI